MGDEASIERLTDGDVEVVRGRPTVVTALPLTREARQRLSKLLDARVVDIREQCDDPDLVLTPSASPQLIGVLGRRYPGARIVVVEVDDRDLDISLGGPVKRLLVAGADAYVVADSIEELAERIGRPAVPVPVAESAEPPAAAELPGGTTVEDLVDLFVRDRTEQPITSTAVDREHERQRRRPPPG